MRRPQPFGRRHEALADLGDELGALGVLLGDLCGHAAPVADAVLRVDHERADALIELAGDPHVLRREQPPGLIGGRHGVVGRQEGDLIDATIAERGMAVASPDPRHRRRVAVREDRSHPDGQRDQQDGRRDGNRSGNAAAAHPWDSASRTRGQRQELGDRGQHDQGPERHDHDSDHGARPQHHRGARTDRHHGAQHALGLVARRRRDRRTGPAQQRHDGDRAHDRGGGEGDHDAHDACGHGPGGDRIQPHGQRRVHRIAIGPADAPGDLGRRERRRQRDDGAGTGQGEAEPQDRRAPGVGHEQRAERQKQRGGECDRPCLARTISPLRDAQHEAVDAALHARNPRDRARGQPLGRSRAQPLDDVGEQEAGVTDLQGHAAGMGIEGRPMGFEGAAAHERPKLSRPDDGTRAELDDRPQRQEVGADSDHDVGEPASGSVADRLRVERRRRPVGEGVGAEDRVLGVCEDGAGRERDGGEHGQDPRDRARAMSADHTTMTGRW